MPEAELDSLSVDQRADFRKEVTDRAKKPFVLVARDEQGTIVGFVNGSLERDRDALYTTERYAKALMLAAVKSFIELKSQRHAALGTVNEPRPRLLRGDGRKVPQNQAD